MSNLLDGVRRMAVGCRSVVMNVALLLFVLWIVSGQCFAAGITVVVNPETTVAGPQLTVGDLAVVSGDDSDKVRAVRELKIGSAPAPGERMVITAEEFSARLVDAGADFNSVSWQIPPLVAITTTGQAVSGQSLQTVAMAEIKRRLGVPADGMSPDVSVTALGEMADKLVPLGRVSLKAELPYGIRLVTPTIANVIISTDGQPAATVSLRFAVKVWQNVVVASRNIAAFEQLTPDSLRVERWDISRLTGYFTDGEKIIGLQTRRGLAAGTPVCESYLQKPLLVKQGSAVIILCQVGDIIVTANGQALQSGCQGGMIRVQNLNSNKVVNAQVVDAATVQVIIYSGR